MYSGETPITHSYGDIIVRETENIGMLSVHVHLYYLQQAKDRSENKTDDYVSQNDREQDITGIAVETSNKEQYCNNNK